jgi:hypothetical protein
MKETPKTQPQLQAQVISNPFAETTSHNNNPPINTVPQNAAEPAPAVNDSPTSPSAAADNDLIEKSWIVAVEKMAKEHGDDPFVLQQKQAELTRDYLKKRFGREIKAS